MRCFTGWGTEWFRRAIVVFGLAEALFANAADQIWNDAGINNTWSTEDLNWDAGAAWTNGNSAVFSGGGGTLAGETVDVSSAVEVVGITFQTNGYVIADTDANGTLTLTGTPSVPSVLTVVNAGDTGTVSEVLAGTNGFFKAGNGQLWLTATNTYLGTTTVSAGTLRLNPNSLNALGAAGGTGNDTVVANGATLDFNGCYAASASSEKFTVSGAGVDGKGVLINTGLGHVNRNIGGLTLLDNTVIGGTGRIDAYTITGNGKTLTKTGTSQLCVQNVDKAEIVINEGQYTVLNDSRALGGSTAGDTTVNGVGNLDCWGNLTVSERITFNGGKLSEGNISNTFTLAGYHTVNSNVNVNSGGMRGVEISGYVDGPGGFTQQNAGWFTLSGNTNTYSGPTIVNAGGLLWIGRPGANNGAWGSGVLTNSGNTYFYSGRFGSGNIVNFGNLYFDRPGTYTMTNTVGATGTSLVRYKSDPVFSGNFFSNGVVRVVDGSLTLTNGASLLVTVDLTLADPQSANYTNAAVTFPVTGTVNITEGTWVRARDIIIGNPSPVGPGLMLVGTINHYGGMVSTYGATAESNGIRVAHYPLGLGTYNMRGGTLIVDNGWDLCIATDGTGWVHQTGGEIYTSRMMVNERAGGGGFGRLTVEGGVLNIGLTNGITNVVANGIAVDSGAPYLVEYGGAGGVVRAVTNFVSALNATLYGTNANAITFDTREWAVSLSGKLTGEGGFNKSGAGTLTLTGANTYTGGTAVLEGTLLVNARSAVPNGKINFGVSTNGACGVLHATGALSLDGLSVGFVNPERADEQINYTVITCDGALSGTLDESFLTPPWRVRYDRVQGIVKLHAVIGTMLWLR